MASNWKWHGEDAESVVLPSVQAIAVYTNPHGDVVIRQEASYGQEEDAVVIIPRSAVKLVIKAMRDEAAKKFEPGSDE